MSVYVDNMRRRACRAGTRGPANREDAMTERCRWTHRNGAVAHAQAVSGCRVHPGSERPVNRLNRNSEVRERA